MRLNDLLKMVMHKPNTQRFIEIDMIRGFAIILMVFGHILWDLSHFGLTPMNNALYSFLQITVPPTFFILVGISLIVSRKKIETMTIDEEGEYYKRLFVRGLKIFSLGMVLTLFSFIFMPETPVYFGVLHCIGLSVLLSAPFLKYRHYALPASMIIIFIGNILTSYPVNNPSILHMAIGLHQTDVWRYTVDYFPLMPWFGITLLGVTIGDWLYCGNRRTFRLPDLSKYRPIKLFQWAGQHSLGIYLLHQPIIAGALAVYLHL